MITGYSKCNEIRQHRKLVVVTAVMFRSSFSLDKVCLNIEGIKNKNNKMTAVLPEYNCLLLSPSNLWHRDFNKFQLDANLIHTVYNYQVGVTKPLSFLAETTSSRLRHSVLEYRERKDQHI